MNEIRRRDFVSATLLAVPTVPSALAAAKRSKPGELSLGFGTYGMPGIKTESAIQQLAGIGFDSIELDIAPGKDAEAANMNAARRRQVKVLLDRERLTLTSLMEHLRPEVGGQQQKANLDRLRRAAELGRQLRPESPPLIQTTLGGGKWEQLKNRYRDQVGAWRDVGRQTGVVIAVKPHRGGAMSRPEHARWLIAQLGDSRWLRMVYDYSHYAFRGMPLENTVRTALPITSHIAVKDAIQIGGKTTFVLPGESGKFDYPSLLKQFYAGGYRGDVCCEVSSAVWRKPGYQALAAARTCYDNMSRYFKQAEVPRPKRR